jgi:hypothetical protein
MWMTEPVAAQYGGFGGFGGAGTGMGIPTQGNLTQGPRLEFRPWISANGTYREYMQSATSADTPTTGTFGYGGAGGLSGGKAWSKTMLGGFYTGSYQHNTNGRYVGGLSQVGGLTVQHSATERLTIFASEFIGSSNGGYGYGTPAGAFGGWGTAGSGVLADLAPGGVGFGDPGSNGLVDNEAFGTRVNYMGTSGGVNYRPNLRWSYGAMGTAAFVRRKGNGLNDLDSYSGSGHVGYQISQSSQVGAYYQYGQFSYPGLFGGNRAQMVGGNYSVAFGPQTTLRLMAGAYRFDSTFLGQVPMDPALSGLLGQSTILTVTGTRRLGWTGSARLARSWRNWGGSIGYDHGLNPGNGVILVSERDSANGSVSTSMGRLSFGGFGGYYRMTGLLQSGASTESISFGASVGVRLMADLHLGFNGGFSKYLTNTSANQWSKFASVHLTWSPREAAFRF